jgi:hypothetical protein
MTALLLFAAPMFSQTATGRIAGTVKDQTGGAIVGAAVVVTDVARGLARNLMTDEGGAYLAPNLLAGTYTIRATYMGFQAFERTNVILPVGGDLFVDVVLQPGAQTQTVTVTEELPLVNTTSAALGGTLNTETISDLPLNGRNFTLLLELRPGVVLTLGNDSGGAGAASANGLRAENSNEYVVEGLHGMSPFNGQPFMNALALRGDASTLLPVDAIQEFNQQFNSKAEYGYRGGGAVNIGLKSGTNAIHGTGYAFFRRDELDARNYFLDPLLDKTNVNLNQFGATFGGPVIQDKMFYFMGYEQQRLNIGDPVRSQSPFTDPAMIANFPACLTGFTCAAIDNVVGGFGEPDTTTHLLLACQAMLRDGTLSPQSLALVGLNSNCTPGATYPNSVTGASWIVPHGASDHGAGVNANLPIQSYYANLQSNVRTLGGVAKVDYALNEKNTMSGFFFVGNGDNTYSANKTSPDWRTNVLARSYMVAGTWTYLPNAAWANAFRLGWGSVNQRYIGVDAALGVTSASLGLNTGITSFIDTGANSGYPQSLAINGFTALGSRNTELEGPQRSTEINDTVSLLAGNHAIRFGGTIMIQAQNGGTWANTRGTFSFGQGASGNLASNGLIAFLSGQNGYDANIPNPDFLTDPDADEFVGYCPPPGVPGLGTCTGAVSIRTSSGGTGLQTAQLFYGNPESHLRRNVFSLFAQDDWRISPRVTLNLGIRWDATSVLHDRDYILSSFDPNLGIVQEGNQIPYVFGPDRNNFAPRFGVAWDIMGNGRTVLRAGGSLIYELVILRTFTEIGNAAGLAGNPSAWVIGCSVATTATIPVGARTNCPGSLLTSGGTRNVGNVAWSRADDTLEGVVLWDRPDPVNTAVFPSTSGAGAILTCSDQIQVRDTADTSTVVDGRPGAPCEVVGVDRQLKTPYVQTWTVSLQHAITNNFVLDMAYVGNHATKLISQHDMNQPAPFVLWNAPDPDNPGQTFLDTCLVNADGDSCDGSALSDLAFESRVFASKFPFLSSITQHANRHTSNYNGFQMSATMRNFRGFSLVSGYTYARALDVSSSNAGDTGTDSYNIGLDYGRAGSDLRHRLTLSPSYEVGQSMALGGLAGGWRITGNMKFQTGRPWAAGEEGDFMGTGRSTRWDFAGDPGDFEVDYTQVNRAIFHPGGTTPDGENPQTGQPYVLSDLALQTPLCTSAASSLATLEAFGCWTQGGSAITPPAPNSFGNMKKGLFDGPSFFTIDMAVAKTQRISERLSAEFRAEVFNILNKPAFAQPENGLGCDSGGCELGITSETPDVGATNPVLGTGGQRRMQFGIKLIF